MLAVYTATMGLSALLLFLVQPMFAKMVLPSLGGTPAVWNTCMVFFQAALLLGYGYAHLGARWLTPKRQAIGHAALLALSLFALPIAPRYTDPGDASPIPWLIGLLTVSLGAPFFMLSATAPLLQRWFASSRHARAGDPYFLYAASNLGSMLALIGYPALVEPWSTLSEQRTAWSLAYGLLAVAVAACGWLSWRSTDQGAEAAPPVAAPSIAVRPITAGRRMRWVLLAMAPSSLFLGLTTYLTTDVAAVPLLWVVPLAIYLLTFVLVFARRPLLPHRWLLAAQPFVLLPALMQALWYPYTSVWTTAPLHLLAFFVCAMVCHGELARDRPEPERLTEFYLWMSLGGVLGGLFNALIAPLVFNGVYEYPIALTLACLLRPQLAPGARWVDWLLPAALAVALTTYVLRFADAPGTAAMIAVSVIAGLLIYASRQRPLRFGLAVGAVLLAAVLSANGSLPVLRAKRSFFGVHRILLDEGYKRLTHGTTIHGAQATDPAQAREPLTYYHRDGPLGQLFGALGPRLAGRHLAAVGLGSGSVACYGEAGQQLTFFEIDPAVVAFATDPRYFSFWSDCGKAKQDIVLGDARLTLAKQPDGGFSLLILDAFSSDAIPLHLVTIEAMRLYLSKLAPGGVIAFHISNRFLDLRPVLGSIAGSLGLAARVSQDDIDDDDETDMRFPATWVLLGRDVADLGALDADQWAELPARPGMRPWTDDYGNILAVLTLFEAKDER